MSRARHRWVRHAMTAMAVALFLSHVAQLAAQNSSATSASQNDSNAQLLERVRQLELKVQQLEEKLSTPVPTPSDTPSSTVSPTPAPVPTAAAPPAPPPVEDVPPVNEVAQRLKLLYFGDVGYEAGQYYNPHSTFYFGEFNMLATARLTSKLSALADVLVVSQLDNSIEVDIERLLLKYRQSRYLTASVGRIHTAIGYYNTAFDRGEYFQTPIGRPAMFEFDDQGGFLPLQDLGITLNGLIPSGKWNLNYVFEVTNGRNYGVNVQPAQNNDDTNNAKAVNFGLSFNPAKTRDFITGFSIRHDYLSDVNNLRVSEIIPVVYAIYKGHNCEWLNEAMWVRHTLPDGSIFRTPGFYTQISKGFGHYRPYFVYSYVNAPLDDPIYGNPAELPIVGRINGPSVGLRYDFSPFTALKVQYQREASDLEAPENGAAAEFSFTF
jgi:hypothetical protein